MPHMRPISSPVDPVRIIRRRLARRLVRWCSFVALPAAAVIGFLLVPGIRNAARQMLSGGSRPTSVAMADDRAGTAVGSEANEETGGDAAIDAEPAGGAGEAPAPALPVSGVVVQSGPLVLTVRASGRAEAPRRVELSSRVSERVVTVHVTEGDRVRAGDLLVELDRRPYEIALREAEARLANAEVDLRIALMSNQASDETPDQNDDAGEATPATEGAHTRRRELAAHRSGYTEATQRVARARLDLESTRILAPFDGEVASVIAVNGGEVLANQPVIMLVNIDRLRVPAEVLETDFGMLERGAGATVRFAAFPDRTLSGAVTALSPVCDPTTGTGVAYVEIENPDRRIRPGMYAEVEIESARHEDRLAVPRAAVLERDRKLLVFRVAAGKAEWQYVTTGLEGESVVEITKGLAPGDTVLTAGHLTLAHGAPIAVTLE